MKRYIALGGVGLFAGAGVLGAGWAIVRRLTAPVGPRTFDLVIRAVEHDGDVSTVVLDRSSTTAAQGIYNLWFEHGGWVQLGSEVLDRGPTLIVRRVTNTAPAFAPRPGDRASWSGIYFASPQDAGLRARDVMVETSVGAAPAWLIEGNEGGDRSTWAIHIHGLGSPRAATLRGVRVVSELGYTSLVISYRNDGEGPRVGSGRSTLGETETEDAEAALEYAARHGAQRIVLFGWSMGAAIALQLADRARLRGLIAGLVLDSPVLDWLAVIKANCERSGLPAVAGALAVPWLVLRPLARMASLPTSVPLGMFKWVTRSSELQRPTLILHGDQDDSAPLRVSRALRDHRPDLVRLEVFDAGHTLAWNFDSERWCDAMRSWLFSISMSDLTAGGLPPS